MWINVSGKCEEDTGLRSEVRNKYYINTTSGIDRGVHVYDDNRHTYSSHIIKGCNIRQMFK